MPGQPWRGEWSGDQRRLHTGRVLCRRHRVPKSGTDHAKQICSGRLSTNPAVCLRGRPNSTFKRGQACIAASGSASEFSGQAPEGLLHGMLRTVGFFLATVCFGKASGSSSLLPLRSPPVHFRQDRVKRFSIGCERVLHPDRHLGEHFAVHETVTFQLSQ